MPGDGVIREITGSGRWKLAVTAVLSGWLILVAYLMILVRTASFEIFFVLWLTGLLILLELSNGRYGSPGHLVRLKYVVIIGVVVFGIIIAGKVMEILNR